MPAFFAFRMSHGACRLLPLFLDHWRCDKRRVEQSPASKLHLPSYLGRLRRLGRAGDGGRRMRGEGNLTIYV